MSYKGFLLVLFLIFAASGHAFAQFELKLNKGLAAYLNKDYQGAVKFLEGALVENPQSPTANHILGLSLLRLNRYNESVTYLEKAKKLDPNIKGIDLDLGTAYLRVGNLKGALVEFERPFAETKRAVLLITTWATHSLGSRIIKTQLTP